MSLAGVLVLVLSVNDAVAGPVDYTAEIKPLLASHCGGCHSALRQKSGLRLDTAVGALAGGDSGPAIVPGRSGESLLIEAVRGTAGFRMPPEGEGTPLTDDEIALLARWIDEGATAPADEPQPTDPREHWAFQPPRRVPLPAVDDPAWSVNPIDAFIAAEHRRHGLTPNAEADKRTLLRRVHVDLVGLLPTADETTAFLADDAPGAYERVVDRLLASPRYGERWGRHWMDVWRYSDWYGRRDVNQHRNSRRHIWRWRDWIVEATNDDRGYDRMVQEMLAGDELAPGDDDTMRATGFLGRSFYVYNRHVWLQDTVEHTAGAFLGLSMKCCRCHDHKYDPIAQDEYYGLRAFFEPHQVRTDRLPGKPESFTVTNASGSGQERVLRDGLDVVFDAEPDAPTYLLVRGNEKNPDTSRTIAPAVPAVLHTPLAAATPIALPRDRYYPELRDCLRVEALNRIDAEIAAARAEFNEAEAVAAGMAASSRAGRALTAARTALEAAQRGRESLLARQAADDAKYGGAAERVAELSLAAATLERQWEVAAAAHAVAALELEKFDAVLAVEQAAEGAPEKLVVVQGKLDQAREALAKAESSSANRAPEYPPLGPVYAQQSSGRRLALARWITAPGNPLTARVAVNHIWLRHFGAPLVATVNDFGLRASPPTNPAMLDWLACELVEARWSMKHLHRLIVTSRTYRQASSAGNGASAAIDPDNRYLWRTNPHRMEAEALRDSLLHLAGVLDFTTGGPDLDPATAETVYRRSLYFRHTPDDKPAMLTAFDAADPAECYRRLETVRPQQALAMANGPLSLAMAERVAANLHADSDDALIAAGFDLLLGRQADDEEATACNEFLAEQRQALGDEQRARAALVHVLMNHHDFLTIH